MREQEKVMYDSSKAAQLKTVTGWVSRHGRFYGDNESTARWDGSTHKICECGKEMEKGWTLCKDCRSVERDEKYKAMPHKDWDGTEPLVIFDDDRYFFTKDDLLDYCDCEEIEPSDLQLVICEPNYPHEIEADDYYCDYLAEDRTLEDSHPELAEAIEKVNEIVRRSDKPLSWSAGKYRTAYIKREEK